MITNFPRVHRATRRDPLGLTRREREVATLLCTLPVSGVAKQLGTRPPTVVRQRREIYRKLAISTRDELRARLTVLVLSEPFGEEMSEARNDWELDPRNFDQPFPGESECVAEPLYSEIHSSSR